MLLGANQGSVSVIGIAAAVGPTRTAFVLKLEPVIVAGVSWAALGLSFGPPQLVGAAIMVTAVIGFQARGTPA